MITIHGKPMTLVNSALAPFTGTVEEHLQAKKKTMAWSILEAHNIGENKGENFSIRFDAMASHDITYVGIIQTARASGLKSFPVPYVMTNCHNSLCAVGGTINEDDHAFGLSAAKKYGGEYVPSHLAVIHQYMRERYAGGRRMILASDSHTRYGAYGTLAIGEGGPELVKQLLSRPYELSAPRIVAIELVGTPKSGVGPQDIALSLIGATFKNGFLKNTILEFVGSGIANLSMDFRNGIDVMTTETACLSSVWTTDEVVRSELRRFGREDAFAAIQPDAGAVYDDAITLDLSKVKPTIALPFHPSNTFTIDNFLANAADILRSIEKEALKQWGITSSLTSLVSGKTVRVNQGVVAGCSGGLAQNLRAMKSILGGKSIGADDFTLSVYPASQPMMLELTRDGTLADLMTSGATIRSAFCGPCFGAGDVPFSGGFSVRHTTRNFPNREGSKPANNQTAYVALMDARSIAATAAYGGVLTSAEGYEGFAEPASSSTFDSSPYSARVYNGINKPDPQAELRFGPNITDWPEIPTLPEDLTITVTSAIYDPVTTTDELIPSGDASSYRSNPMKLAEMTLSRKDPEYVSRCKALGFGSVVCAIKPGDGSAREQAASCQRVLGGVANIAVEYATKRYRSNLINWGMLPFTLESLASDHPEVGDTYEIASVRSLLLSGAEDFPAIWCHQGVKKQVILKLPSLSVEDRDIIAAGCLMNYYAGK